MRDNISFEQHLVKKGLLTEEDFTSVLLDCKYDNQSFCKTAVELGLISVRDFFKIYSIQSNTDHSIEEIALKKGFLTQDQVKAIHDRLDEINVSPIEQLIRAKKITSEKVEAERAEFFDESYTELIETQDRIKYILMDFEIFSHLNDDVFKALSLIAIVENFSEGDIVIKEGTDADSIYCIVSGSLSITKKQDEGGKDLYLSSLTEGAVLGEASIFEKGTRTATVTADTDTVLIRFDRFSFLTFLRDYPKSSQSILIFIIQGLLQRLYMTNKELVFERKDSVSQDDIDSLINDFYKS
jgi:CRP-like cAMP-binding protein